MHSAQKMRDTSNLRYHPPTDQVSDSHPSIKGGNGGENATVIMSMTEWASGLWSYVTNTNEGSPRVALPTKPVEMSHFTGSGLGRLTVTWLGHSSLMINMEGYRVLTDPVLEKRLTVLGPARYNGDVPLEIDKIGPVDAVIISHDHYDHLNKYSVQRLNALTKRFVVPTAVGQRLVQWGIPEAKIVELAWWEEYRSDDDLMIAATPAQHFSGRGLTDGNRTLWASWVLQTPNYTVFFSGDSGYFNGFKQIGGEYGPFDMTFIECGAYNASWSQVHMFPEETVQAHLDLGGRLLHPIHWGTFNLALHPWYEPMQRLTAAAQAANVAVATPEVGETTVYGIQIPATRWWEVSLSLAGDATESSWLKRCLFE